jgi:hypothetical protein
MRMALMLIPVLAMIQMSAAEPVKPACTKTTQGHVWVERNDEGRTVHTEVCSLEVWRYRWRQVTVHASELGKKGKDPKTGEVRR